MRNDTAERNAMIIKDVGSGVPREDVIERVVSRYGLKPKSARVVVSRVANQAVRDGLLSELFVGVTAVHRVEAPDAVPELPPVPEQETEQPPETVTEPPPAPETVTEPEAEAIPIPRQPVNPKVRTESFTTAPAAQEAPETDLATEDCPMVTSAVALLVTGKNPFEVVAELKAEHAIGRAKADRVIAEARRQIIAGYRTGRADVLAITLLQLDRIIEAHLDTGVAGAKLALEAIKERSKICRIAGMDPDESRDINISFRVKP